MALLGLDVGTSEIKAAAYRLDGDAICASRMEYAFEQSFPGRFELSADTLWNAICDAIRSVTRSCPEPIEALAVAAHGESFVCVDDNGEPIHPFILNVDNRAGSQMDRIVELVGRQRVYELTGMPSHPMYCLPKILWLAECAPHVFRKARRFLCVHDFVMLRLCGEAVIDHSQASRTLAFDINSEEWCTDLLCVAGISSDRFAGLARSGTPVHSVLPQLAGDLGLESRVLCVAGAHDQVCSALGGGSIHAGDCADVTGTFEVISVVQDKPLVAARALDANLPCERFVGLGSFLTLAYSPGGIVLKWLRNQWADPSNQRASYAEMTDGLSDTPASVFIFPHLLGTGTPWLNAEATGAVVGLRMETDRRELVRAALEGISYEMRWNIEILASLGIRIARVRACGGGAKSRFWLQLKADVWGTEIVAVPGEAGCRGAAICAGIGSGAYASWEEGVRATRQTGSVYEPRPSLHEVYSERFAHYQEIADRLYGFSFSLPRKAEPHHIGVSCTT